MNKENPLEGRRCPQHSNRNIILFCLNGECSENKLLCDKCIQQHPQHNLCNILDLDLDKRIKNLITDSNSKIEVYNIPINDLIISIGHMKEIITNKFNILFSQLNNEKNSLDTKRCQNHQKEIKMICKNMMCVSNKYLCNECQSDHQGHQMNLLNKECFTNMQLKLQTKFDGLKILIDQLPQKLVCFQSSIKDQYKTTSQNLSKMNNCEISQKLSTLQKFIAGGQKEAQQLQYFQIIMREMKLSFKQVEQIGQYYQVTNNFDKILQAYGKKLDKNDKLSISLRKGEILRMIQNFDQSLCWFDISLKINAICKEALWGKGECLKSKKEYDLSLKQLDEALEIDHKYISALSSKGDVIRLQNKYQESLEYYDKALDFDQNHLNSLCGKGHALRMLNQTTESINLFDRALSLELQCLDALCGKGLTLLKLHKELEAIKLFESVLKIDPSNANALYGKGETLRLLGEYQKSIELYEKVRNTDYQYFDALCGTGHALRMLKKYKESLDLFDKAISINPQYRFAFWGKGQLLRLYSKNQESIDWFYKAIAINPQFKLLFFGKGHSLRMLERYQESIDWLDKALSIDDKFIDAISGKGHVLRMLGRHLESILWYDKAIYIDSGYIDALCGKGDALGKLNRFQESIECYNKVLAIDSENQDALKGQGELLKILNNYQESIERLDQAIAINPNNIEAYKEKGDTLRILNKYQQSVECYDKVISIVHQYVDALCGKGDILRIIGKYEQSLECYDKVLAIDPKNFDALQRKSEIVKMKSSNLMTITSQQQAQNIDPENFDPDPDQGKNSFTLIVEHPGLDTGMITMDLKPVNQQQKEEFLIQTKKVQKSLKFFNNAISIDFCNNQAYKNKGYTLNNYHSGLDIGMLNLYKKLIECLIQVISINQSFGFSVMIENQRSKIGMFRRYQETDEWCFKAKQINQSNIDVFREKRSGCFIIKHSKLNVFLLEQIVLFEWNSTIDTWYLNGLERNTIDQRYPLGGEALTILQKYQDSLYLFNKAISINSSNFSEVFEKVIVSKCINNNSQKNDDLIIKRYFKMITTIYANNEKEDTLILLKKYEESIECFGKSISISQQYLDALFKKGDCLKMLQKYQESIRWFNKVISIDSNHIPALLGIGDALKMLKVYKESIEWFDKALAIDSNNVSALLKKGDILMKLNKFDEFIKFFNKALLIFPINFYASQQKGNQQIIFFLFIEALNNYHNSVKIFDKSLVLQQKINDDYESQERIALFSFLSYIQVIGNSKLKIGILNAKNHLSIEGFIRVFDKYNNYTLLFAGDNIVTLSFGRSNFSLRITKKVIKWFNNTFSKVKQYIYEIQGNGNNFIIKHPGLNIKNLNYQELFECYSVFNPQDFKAVKGKDSEQTNLLLGDDLIISDLKYVVRNLINTLMKFQLSIIQKLIIANATQYVSKVIFQWLNSSSLLDIEKLTVILRKEL